MIFKKIAANLTSILTARILFQVFNAITQITIARMLGVDKFGMFSTALALVNAFLVANDIGMSTLMIREGSRIQEKMKYYLGNTLVVQLIASFIFYAIALIVGFSIGYSFQIMMLVIILGIAYMIYEFRKPLRAVLRIILKLKFVALIEIICGLGIMSSVILLSFSDINKEILLYLVVVIELIGYSILSIAIFIYARKFVKPDFSHTREIMSELKVSWKYSMYNIMFIIYLQLSIIMVGAIAGNAEAGLYAAASKLVVLTFMIPQMIFQVGLPLFFKYYKEDIEKYKRIHRFIFKYLNALGFPVAVGMWILSLPIIELIYNKPGYMPAALALQYFGIFVIFRYLGNVSGQSLTTSDHQVQKLIIGVCYLVLLAVCNFFAISAYGFMGAVGVTIICEALLRMTYIIFDFTYLKLKVWPYIKRLIPTLFATAIMGIFVYFTQDLFNVIITIVLSAILYGFLLWLFRFFDQYDKKLFIQLINKAPKNIK